MRFRKLKRKIRRISFKNIIFELISHLIILPAIIVEIVAVCYGDWILFSLVIVLTTALIIILKKLTD